MRIEGLKFEGLPVVHIYVMIYISMDTVSFPATGDDGGDYLTP